MKTIKSFEESPQGTYGDILSARRDPSGIRVGLLLFGYFEYWRMFPELRMQVENNLKVVADRLSARYEIVSTDLIDTLDSADISGKILKDSEIDALVIVMGTYLPDFITMHTINYVRDIPILIFSAQESGNIDKNSTYAKRLCNSGMLGVAQLTATFRKTNRKYKVVVGNINDDGAYEKIDKFLSSIQAIKDIKEANIGVIGNVFRGMYDLELSKTFLKGTFDVNVIYIQNTHLFNSWELTTEKDAQEVAERLISKFEMRSVTKQDVIRACRLYLAMRRLIDDLRLDSLCFLDQHYIQKLFGTTARIGASLLLEELSVPVSCEGDIGGLVLTMLMQSLSKRNPVQCEWGEYDEATDSCLLIGHGVADSKIAVSDKDVKLTRTPESWGTSTGLNYEFRIKPGVCTVSSLLELPAKYTMLVSKAESIPAPAMDINEVYALVRFNMPIKQYLEKVFEYGISHHCYLIDADIVDSLKTISELLNIEVFSL